MPAGRKWSPRSIRYTGLGSPGNANREARQSVSVCVSPSLAEKGVSLSVRRFEDWSKEPSYTQQIAIALMILL